MLKLLALARSRQEPRDTLDSVLESLDHLLPIDVSYIVVARDNEVFLERGRIAGASVDRPLELREVLVDCIGQLEGETKAVDHGELGRVLIAQSPFAFRSERVVLTVTSEVGDFPNETEEAIVCAATRLCAEGLEGVSGAGERAPASWLEGRVATVVHELRHPLAPIVMALGVLKATADAATSDAIGIIERQVSHLSRLLDDLSRVLQEHPRDLDVNSGVLDVTAGVLDLADAIDDGIEAVRPLLARRRHDLRVDISARRLFVTGDRTRLAEVVANLLSNAAQYTEPGGHIELSVRRMGSEIALSVRDDGVGIRADLFPYLFDRFVRGAQSGDYDQRGRGIGLAVVKRLVSLHGGTITASSAGTGQGSEFTVCLPAVDEAPSS